MIFQVLSGQGLGNNAMKGGNRRAVSRQTQHEHDTYLDPKIQFPEQYRMAMGMPEPMRSTLLRQLDEAAVEYEKNEIPEYWDDNQPRRPVMQSSSWVGNIDYNPESREAIVHVGDKAYTYVNVEPQDMARLLNAPSIGRVLNAARVPHPKGEIVYHGF